MFFFDRTNWTPWLWGVLPVNGALIAAALMKPIDGSWAILDKYGIPTFMLLLLAAAIYKLFWPVLIKQLEVSEKRAEAALSVLEQTAKKQADIAEATAQRNETRFDKQSADFIRSLAVRDELAAEQFKELNASNARNMAEIITRIEVHFKDLHTRLDRSQAPPPQTGYPLRRKTDI